jgi:hypothetical protein
MYSKLVPSEVSHKLFWARYFYKVCIFGLEENKTKIDTAPVAAIPTAKRRKISQAFKRIECSISLRWEKH